MKKKSVLIVLTMIFIVEVLVKKVNKNETMSDIALANIEALAMDEMSNGGYSCYGEGNVFCPFTGRMVAGYIILNRLE